MPRRTWIVTDGRAGNEKPCVALAMAMGLQPDVKRSAPTGTARWLAPRLSGRRPYATTGDPIEPPWPDLVISAGRLGAALSRAIRTRSRRTFTVNLLDPRVSPRHWDVVVAPAHDRLRGDNVVTTLGSVHGIDDVTLAVARERFGARLNELPAPRIAVLLGGPHRAFPDWVARAERALTWGRQQGASLMVTGSSRTPPTVLRQYAEFFRDGGRGELYDGEGDNPYLGYLAWADAIAVTPDSVNMVSEALGVGVPVAVDCDRTRHRKFRDFFSALRDRELINALAETPPRPPPTPLREVAEVAANISRRYGRPAASERVAGPESDS